jgi:hypothetical protein
MHRNALVFTASAALVALALFCLRSGYGALAEESEKAEASVPLRGVGKLGKAIRGSDNFYEFTLQERDAKGKLLETKLLLKIPEKAVVLRDQRIEIKAILKGETACVLGRPVAYDVRDKNNPQNIERRGKDYQIQASQAVFVGKEIKTRPDYRDPKQPELRWCQGAVAEEVSKGLWVDYEEHPHKVVLTREAPVIRRLEAERKLLKSGAGVYLEARETSEKPSGPGAQGSDEKRYEAGVVILLDPKLAAGLYAAMF